MQGARDDRGAERCGEAEVLLAGRKFKIKKQFLADAAAQIFTTAKHPKSFISLAWVVRYLT
ncbi:MAG TPA: hypothetical protein VEU32_19450 [Burkholderiales bacterium]|nr:hypothetical protein [Burkholderiales bacterium]